MENLNLIKMKSRVFNVSKKRTSRYDHQSVHAAYGIQNYLVKNKLISKNGKVNRDEYVQLLRDFAQYCDIDFVFPKQKTIKKLERYVQNRFPEFVKFCKETIYEG